MMVKTQFVVAAALALSWSPTTVLAAMKPSPIPLNYIEWTAGAYGDGGGTTTYSASTESEVVFWWESGTQDVWKMYDEACWKNCDFSYAVRLIEPVTSGGSYTEESLDLQSLGEGTHYLANGVGTHCQSGQKLILTTWKNEWANDASGWNAFVGAGASNAATGDWATIGGGYNNRATGKSSVVLGGIGNDCISNYCTVVGGYKNAAKSRFATTLGGAKNTASGRFSLAAGFNAQTAEDNSAAFGFSGSTCSVETARTVGFCADAFYLNDINILEEASARRLTQDTRNRNLDTLAKLEDTMTQHRTQLDELRDCDSLHERVSTMMDRIELKLSL